MKERSISRRILFPWEARGGLRRWLALGQIRPFALGAVVLLSMLWIGAREREHSGTRQTRARLEAVRVAVSSYMAEHDGKCPADLDATAAFASFERAPRDAWGRPFRLVCPSRRPGYAYELSSDGPDGQPGGLDRIE